MDYAVREEWLAQVTEAILEPDRVIVDPHHHFFAANNFFQHYDLARLRADTASHRVAQTVYLECGEGYRTTGPEALKPVGETESVADIAARAQQDPQATQLGAIVGTANLRLGAGVREVLEAHVEASTLFRGIRQCAAWDGSRAVPVMAADGELYRDPAFREGFTVLTAMGLSFDAWHYHHQTPYLTELARVFPETTIVLDHLGTPLGVGPYAGRRDEVFTQWASDLVELARCPNVFAKLGGLAMPWNGFGFEDRALPPTSDDIVAAHDRYYQHAIQTFGPERCMFESNFPVDKYSVSYAVLWNAFKKMATTCTETEKDSLFRGTATGVYRLQPRG
jgi:predicted TIM-barrel fold metal-dependent hydrolase